MRYMPSRTPATVGPARGGGQPGSYGNPPYPGNRGEGDPINGYPPGSTTPGYIDYRNPENNGPFYPGTTRQQYRDDPNARSIHTPGSSRGQQSGWWETSGKNLSDIHQPATWTAEDEARDQATQATNRAHSDRVNEVLMADPEYARAKAAGDWRGMSAAQMRLKDNVQMQKFIAQGGTEEVYRDRFNRDWPKPRSPLGAYSHGPGSADWDTRFTNPPPPNTAGVGGGGVRRGATPQDAPMSAGAPPSANPMFTGYGGPGVVSGGQGGQFGSAGGSRMDMSNFARDEQMALQNARMRQGGTDWWNPGGGYNPGQSKSGMGQSPYGGGMSTGGDMSMDAYNPGGGMASIMAAMQGGGMGGGAPYYNPNAATMGGGMNDYLMSMMMNGMGGRMSPGQGFGGRSAFSMDPGMMGFGYAPMY